MKAGGQRPYRLGAVRRRTWGLANLADVLTELVAKRFKRNNEGNSSNDHAQFTITVTAVVAVIAPLEPVTSTV